MKKPVQKVVKDIFEAKRQRRRKLAKLPIEEKVKILVQLQKMAIPALRSQGLKRKLWKL